MLPARRPSILMMDSKRSKAGRERTKTTATRMKMKMTEPEVDHDYGSDGLKAVAGKFSETTRCQKQSTCVCVCVHVHGCHRSGPANVTANKKEENYWW